ncbi:MAG: protein translocase subunit SecD [Christensenellales bacterium]
MRKGNVITIILLLLLGVCVYFGMMGATIGIYRMKPWPEQISLGLDLTGGGSVVYQAEKGDMSDEEFDARLNTTMGVFRARLDQKNLTEATVVSQGTDRIRIEIPTKDEEPGQVFAMLGKPAVLEFKDALGNTGITGDMVKSAQAGINSETGQPIVNLEFSTEGAVIFAQMTADAYRDKTPVHIVVDGMTLSSPTVSKGAITGGSAYIEGSFTQKTAQDLAVQIASGAIPLKLNEIEQRSISASLGEDALYSSLFAGLVGLCVLFIFLTLYYRLPGLLACVSLIVYGSIILFTLAAFKIQLTLPGIAGLILGVGMAVDANVIIFERFKEELSAGKTLRSSLNSGFSKALWTIIDSNITTFIAAVVIAWFGVGTVKGFGYTLMISIVASMFSVFTVTRALMRLVLAFKIKNLKLYARRGITQAPNAKGGE